MKSRRLKVLLRILRERSELALAERLYVCIRWILTPYNSIVKSVKINRGSKVLDLASGHGLLAELLSLHYSDIHILGIDHDGARIASSQKATQKLDGLRFEKQDMQEFLTQPNLQFDAIYAIDVLHYFDFENQKKILQKCHQILSQSKGTLVFRELLREKSPSYWINYVYEKVASFTGLTKSKNKASIFIRNRSEWDSLLLELGYEHHSSRSGLPIFNDYLYVARPKA